jgi:hypothetical protein
MTETSDPSSAPADIDPGSSGILDVLEAAATGLPAPVRRNAWHAFSRLCAGLAAIPVVWLEGKAEDIRATTAARTLLTATAAKQIANSMQVAPEFAEAAAIRHGQKIVGKQINLNKVVKHAVEDLGRLEVHVEQVEPPQMSEDWLNAFEDRAANMSSEDMQRLFGRILAGEIRKPGAFSIRTLNVISQLDNNAARLFTRLCSLAVSIAFRDPSGTTDSRVIALGGNASANVLREFGLGFGSLTVLEEYGLIITDFNSYIDYKHAIAVNGEVGAAFRFQGTWWALVSKTGAPPAELRIHGVKLSGVGRELLPIVEIEKDEAYAERLVSFFDTLGFDLARVKEEASLK